MKPYIFSYSEEIEITMVKSLPMLNESTVRTFAIENDDNSSPCMDGTIVTESIENIDTENYFLNSTIVTNIIENSDQDHIYVGTSETRTLEVTDSDEIGISFDTTVITKTFESSDAD